MRYQTLKHSTIKLSAKGESTFDAKDGVVLVPNENSKVFIHWINENGKMTATYTMTFPTRVEGRVTLINGLDQDTTIRIIEI